MSLSILIVDDDTCARQQMRQLLARCGADLCSTVEEAADAGRAAGLMRHRAFDLLLLDVEMPGQDGMSLASSMRWLPQKPAVVFVTGHPQHALAAFEADAIDYLTKPVRPERLERALHKAARLRAATHERPREDESLRIVRRGQVQRLPLDEVLYLRAEEKRLCAVTARGRFMLDGSLVDMEKRYAGHLLRVHRHTLAVRSAVMGVERVESESDDEGSGAGWQLSLRGTDERLPVARRMVPEVRAQLLQRDR